MSVLADKLEEVRDAFADSDGVYIVTNAPIIFRKSKITKNIDINKSPTIDFDKLFVSDIFFNKDEADEFCKKMTKQSNSEHCIWVLDRIMETVSEPVLKIKEF